MDSLKNSKGDERNKKEWMERDRKVREISDRRTIF